MRGSRPLQSSLLRLRDLTTVSPSSQRWGLAPLQGRLGELSSHGASARLTAAFGLVLEAQKNGEPVAWVLVRGSSFLPADAAEGGIDLTGLVVVRATDGAKAARAAEQLARSGAFGLIVIDLDSHGTTSLSGAAHAPILTRLVGLCQKHETALVFLTDKPASTASLSSLVSLRAEASREVEGGARSARGDGTSPCPTRTNPQLLPPKRRFTRREALNDDAERDNQSNFSAACLERDVLRVRVEVLKDKRRGPGAVWVEECRAPAGLR